MQLQQFGVSSMIGSRVTPQSHAYFPFEPLTIRGKADYFFVESNVTHGSRAATVLSPTMYTRDRSRAS